MKEDNLVLAKVYDNDAKANIALGILRTNGIPCALFNEMSRNVFGIQLSPNDGIRLMVLRDNLDEALDLIKDV